MKSLALTSVSLSIIGVATESAAFAAAGVVVYALWICVDEIKIELEQMR